MLVTATKNWPKWLSDSNLPIEEIIPDLLEGWAGNLTIRETVNEDMFQKYMEVVRWINNNIANPTQNAYWTKDITRIYVFIRKPADLTALLLRWG